MDEGIEVIMCTVLFSIVFKAIYNVIVMFFYFSTYTHNTTTLQHFQKFILSLCMELLFSEFTVVDLQIRTNQTLGNQIQISNCLFN